MAVVFLLKLDLLQFSNFPSGNFSTSCCWIFDIKPRKSDFKAQC